MQSSNSKAISAKKLLLNEFQLEMASDSKNWNSTNALRTSLKSLKRPEVFELSAESLEVEGFYDSNSYWSCIYDLQYRPEPETFEACQTWAKSQRSKLRKAACGILGELGTQENLPFKEASQPLLEELLADANTHVIAAALFAMGKLQIGNLEFILPLTKHPEPEVRHAVAFCFAFKI